MSVHPASAVEYLNGQAVSDDEFDQTQVDLVLKDLEFARALLAEMSLYTGRYQARQLTTEQRAYMHELTGYGEFDVARIEGHFQRQRDRYPRVAKEIERRTG